MDTRREHILAMPQPGNGQAELVAQIVKRLAADVAERHPLEPPPDAFNRIQFWCIAWEWQQLQPPGCSIRQEPLNLVAAMNRRAIPHDQHLPRHLMQNMLQKRHDSLPVDRHIPGARQQAEVLRYGTDDRQMITRQWDPQRREFSMSCRTAWCPCFHQGW